jgi:hypothetical protein
MEKSAASLAQTFRIASAASKPFSKVIASTFAATASLPEIIASHKEGRANWFIYRFLDERTGGYAVEWRISRAVIDEYGPLLRGSVMLAFHGDEGVENTGDRWINLLLRPQINFHRSDPLRFVSLRDEKCPAVRLSVQPRKMKRRKGRASGKKARG